MKYIIPFKYEPELLKKPPVECNFIYDEDWNTFVKNRLFEKFQVHIYIIDIKHTIPIYIY